MDTSLIHQLLPQVIAAVERAGVLLAQECVRPGGRRGCVDKAEIDVEIEALLRAELLALLDCDWWGEETGHVLSGYPFCWVVDPNDGTSDFLRGLAGSAISVACSMTASLSLEWCTPLLRLPESLTALPGQRIWII